MISRDDPTNLESHDLKAKSQKRMRDITTVIYAVVLAYGFSLFDRIWSTEDILSLCLYFLAYSIVLIDWTYAQSQYDEWGDDRYSPVFFIVDFLALFVIGRLIYCSAIEPEHYWECLSVLFSVYIVWELIIRYYKKLHMRFWTDNLVSDVMFLVYCLAVTALLRRGDIELDVPVVVATCIAFLLVFRLGWLGGLRAMLCRLLESGPRRR